MAIQTYKTTEIETKIRAAGFVPLDVLLVGATGVGKSSTLNALFGSEIAKVGTGADPETQLVESYRLNDVIRFWDSAGLGDGKEADKRHIKNLTDILCKTYKHSDGTWGFIDLVVVVVDGSLRDLGTTFNLLENVILKTIQPERVIVLINQCDIAMKGHYWDRVNHVPKHELKDFLNEKVRSVKRRLEETPDLDVRNIVYYSATERYGLSKVMDTIIHAIPQTKRALK
jgi:hypothetical protein